MALSIGPSTRPLLHLLPRRTPQLARSSFHTSAPNLAKSKETRRLIRNKNIARQNELARTREESKPHLALGTRPGPSGDAKWSNSELASLLVTPASLEAGPKVQRLGGNNAEDGGGRVQQPLHFNFGIDGGGKRDLRSENVNLLMDALPRKSASITLEDQPKYIVESQLPGKINTEMRKLEQFAKLVDLRNANAEGIAYENRRRIIHAFSDPEKNAFDTGRPEVQAAILTMRIRSVWAHRTHHTRDIHSKRSLRSLVHQRAKVLKYLKAIDRGRYEKLLHRIGVEAQAVEGELVVR